MSDSHHHHHHHHHSLEGDISVKRIFWTVILNLIITLTEVIGGILSGSLALLSDSVHNFSDTISIATSYFAARLAQKPKNAQKTFGYKRAEILAAFFNSAALIGISIFLLWEAYQRWLHPQPIKTNLMLIVATIGLLANFLSVYLLHSGAKGSMNIRSSYLHLISDTVSSIGVILGGIAIKFWGIVWIDPLLTILISLYLLKESWSILKFSVDILMQSSPQLDYQKIKEEIENIPRVKNIHHVHSWMSNEKTIYFEAHLELEDMLLSDAQQIYHQVEHLLKEHYGISHLTIQLETDRCPNKEMF